jgi:chromosome segregation ATPase
MWCDSCAAKDQEIADLKRKTQAAEAQLLELRNAATEATEAWNSWERSCEQKDAEIAELKRQLAEARNTIQNKDELLARKAVTIIQCWNQLDEARKDTERLNWLAERILEGHVEISHGIEYRDQDEPTLITHDNEKTIEFWWAATLREAIDAAREGK